MGKNKRELTLRFLAEPTDVNFGGKVHGLFTISERENKNLFSYSQANKHLVSIKYKDYTRLS